MTKKRSLIERLDQDNAVICAEGFLFEMERRGYLTSGEFVPEVALENPQALKNLHIDFQYSGSDIVEAFTYNGHREKNAYYRQGRFIGAVKPVSLKNCQGSCR